MRLLVTGATGYVGGRLVPRLLSLGHEVRVLARDPARLAGRSWAGRVEVARGDALRPETLAAALRGVDAAYYLVHAMGAGPGFAGRDVAAARGFGAAARAAGVRHLVYLGGLGDEASPELSTHLASRHATGAALREAGVPVTELRAAVIVGAGSVSFELVRYLAERLPVMICPRWVYRRIQPIAIRDVLAYLAAALDLPPADRVVEIGGADVLTYRDMILGYARARGLRRRLVPVPVLTPRLSSLWVHAVTPIPRAIAQPLVEGLRSEVVVRSPLARELFPSVRPLSYAEALAAALAKLERGELESRWSDALASSQGDREVVALETREGLVAERRELAVAAPPAAAFRVFSGLGGERGWPAGNALWRLRGAIDRLAGGVGLRRGRRHPDELRAGDALDFWRVEAVEPDRLLRLRAEMKVPGRAWLELVALPAPGGARLVQTAYFAPRGLAGLAYWWLLYPVHAVIFSRMAKEIARRAEAAAASTPASTSSPTPTSTPATRSP